MNSLDWLSIGPNPVSRPHDHLTRLVEYPRVVTSLVECPRGWRTEPTRARHGTVVGGNRVSATSLADVILASGAE
eukprot:8552814-Pyramimonas_sp.AAC.1